MRRINEEHSFNKTKLKFEYISKYFAKENYISWCPNNEYTQITPNSMSNKFYIFNVLFPTMIQMIQCRHCPLVYIGHVPLKSILMKTNHGKLEPFLSFPQTSWTFVFQDLLTSIKREPNGIINAGRVRKSVAMMERIEKLVAFLFHHFRISMLSLLTLLMYLE